MSAAGSWGWPALFLLGAYHGINPGMGWLFAVALGMQERSGRAVARSLLPLALGHGVAIAAVVLAAGLLQVVLPLGTLKLVVAAILLTLGIFWLVRSRHPRWGGMQVGFSDLTIWSFLMASAHGAGLMLLPVLFGMSTQPPAGADHAVVMSAVGGPATGVLAVVLHTVGYLLVMGLVAWVVYQKLGLALLRKAWLNLDLIWAIALLVTAGFTLLL